MVEIKRCRSTHNITFNHLTFTFVAKDHANICNVLGICPDVINFAFERNVTPQLCPIGNHLFNPNAKK